MRNNAYNKEALACNVWIPKDQLPIMIKDMTHFHIKNAIKWGHRKNLGSALAIYGEDNRWKSKKKFAIKELSVIKCNIDDPFLKDDHMSNSELQDEWDYILQS